MDKHEKLRKDLLKRYAPGLSSVVVKRDDGLHVSFPTDDRLFIAERFARILEADMHWFEHIISHQPTVGAFYEMILRNTLKELAPSGVEIATGFVLDPYRRNHSKQLDIIAYDSRNSSPVFKNGDLVIVRPASVVSVTEVKKTLRMSDIEETIDGTFFSNLGTHRSQEGAFDEVQNLNIFGFSSNLKINSLAEKIRDYLDRKIKYTRVQHKTTKQIGSVMLRQIVLPKIFVRNDRFYIGTHLVPVEGDEFSYKIEVTVYKSVESSGCTGAFFLKALPMFGREQTAFIGSNLELIERSVQTEGSINLFSVVSMDEIHGNFKRDHAEILNFRVEGSSPHSVSVPKGLSWRSLSSFEKFVSKVGARNFHTDADDD
jgi:hypothetical protein